MYIFLSGSDLSSVSKGGCWFGGRLSTFCALCEAERSLYQALWEHNVVMCVTGIYIYLVLLSVRRIVL